MGTLRNNKSCVYLIILKCTFNVEKLKQYFHMKKALLLFSVFLICFSSFAQKGKKKTVKVAESKRLKIEQISGTTAPEVREDKVALKEAKPALFAVEDEEDQFDNEVLKKLQLKDDQLELLRKADEEFKRQLEEIAADDRAKAEEKRQRRSELLKQKRARLEEVLSPEQGSQYMELIREKLRSNYSGSFSIDKISKIIKELGLKEEQQEKINNATNELRERMAQLKTSSDVKEEQKNEEVRNTITTFSKALRESLTGDQYEKFRAIAKENKLEF